MRALPGGVVDEEQLAAAGWRPTQVALRHSTSHVSSDLRQPTSALSASRDRRNQTSSDGTSSSPQPTTAIRRNVVQRDLESGRVATPSGRQTRS